MCKNKHNKNNIKDSIDYYCFFVFLQRKEIFCGGFFRFIKNICQIFGEYERLIHIYRRERLHIIGNKDWIELIRDETIT